MARTCTACIHPKLEEIDKSLLIDGLSIRNIAKQHGLTAAAVHRHKAHASEVTKRAAAVREYRRGEKLLDRVEDLTEKSFTFLKKVEDEKDWKTGFVGVRESRNCLELVGRLTGELKEKEQDGTTNNYMAFLTFLDSPAWAEMKRQRGIPVETTAKADSR